MAKFLNYLLTYVSGTLSAVLVFWVSPYEVNSKIISVDETFFSCKLFDECSGYFTSSKSTDRKDTKNIRRYAVENLVCYASFEQPKSIIHCYDEKGPLLAYDSVGGSVSLEYGNSAHLMLFDTDYDGQYDALGYNGVDGEGSATSFAKDVNLDGCLDSISVFNDRDQRICDISSTD